MFTSSKSRRQTASLQRQFFAVVTAAFIILQPALFASNAFAQKATRTLPPHRDAGAPPNDTGTGSVSLNTIGAAATENFDTLSNTAGSTTNSTLPTGWYLTETGGGARDNEQYAVDTGGSTTGDTYSYGAAAATDRALGGLRSGTLIPVFGAKFTNNTGQTITSLDVAYTGEQWRLGTAARTDQINFEISTNATDLSTGTYTGVAALNFTTPDTATVGAKNGNAAADRTARSSTISSLNIANGASFFIRWTDTDATGADDGLAVDDFSITPQGGAVTPTLNIGDVTQIEGDAGTSTFSFPVTLTAPAGAGGVSFTVNTADGTTNPATAGSDYVAITNGSGSIAQGNSSTTVSVTVNGDTTPEPNETFFVNISNITGANAGDVQGLGTITNDDVTLTAIHTIQGSGTASPLAGQSVTTRGIVTGIKAGSSGGFFIQEPDATVDADPNTSEGIFVFTGASVPAAAVVGNNAQVTGTVQEFVFTSDPNSPPITEISSVTSTLTISTGNPLPAAHVLTGPETTAASGTTNPLDSLEEFEGMRVTAASLTVVAPTQGTITEPSATVASTGVFYGVITGVARPVREPGINVSDPLPSGAPATIPRFDENPERIRVDSDGQPGTTAVDVNAGTVLTNVTGPLDYQFRTYTILPDATITVGTQPGSVPAPTPSPNELTVASFNMERFFDTVNDPATSDPVLTQAAFDKRLDKASRIIRAIQRYPDVIGVEEMENLSTLQAVAAKVNADAQSIDGRPNPNYVAYLVEGNDVGGIDVGFLVKESRVTTVNVTQDELAGCDHVTPSTCFNYTNPNNGQLDILNDRPPLILRATAPRPAGGTFAFTVIVNHLRSLNGIDDNTVDGSGTVGARVREKRRKQAEFLANLIQTRQTADPTEHIISVGDMNAFNINDGYVDVIGTVKGTPSPASQVVLASPDLVNPDLTNLVDTLPAPERYSYSFDGNAQVLDQIIVNQAALAFVNRFAYARDDADYAVKNYELANELRISDHDQPIVYLSLSASGVAQPAGSVLISEFRFRGPGIVAEASQVKGGKLGLHAPIVSTIEPNAPGTNADNDEFIELYNNTNADITVATTDGSAGWSLVAADGTTRFTIPNGTIIPARGHYLGVNSDGYSLADYGGFSQATGDISYTTDIPNNSGIALFRTANPVNFTLAERLDAAGYSSAPALYREGAGFATGGNETTSDIEYSFVRSMARDTNGLPKDTGDNVADFIAVNTVGMLTGQGRNLGAPGPENLASPIQRNSQFASSLLDTSVSSSASPNRVRNFTSDPANNSTFGTMAIRRTFTNNTGFPVGKLRFRIVEITTFPSPGGGTADLRARNSSTETATTGGGTVTVHGTTVEVPPAQPNGGGVSTSMNVGDINIEATLAPGQSVSVQFLLGIQQTGNFRFFINVEAAPGFTGPPPLSTQARGIR